MKRIYDLLAVLIVAVIAMPMSAQVSNENEDGVYKVQRPQAKEFVPGQVLFKLKDGHQAHVRRVAGRVQSAGINSLDAVLKEYAVEEMKQLLPNAKVKGTPRRAKAFNGATIVERDLTQLYKVTLSEEKVHETLQLVEQLKALPEVEFAEPNYKVFIMADEHIADSYSGNPYATQTQQWYLFNYGVPQLWGQTIVNSKRPVIAIIDTGVDLTHPDLKDNLWTNQTEAEGEAGYDNDNNGFAGDVHGWDFINNTGNIRDNNMHGTHVAGIAAASNNDIGIIGANPLALIMAVSVMQSDGSGDIATIAQGIDYAAQNGADVLNLSLGTYANSLTLRQALERAYQTTVIVAAAGNDGQACDPECYPLWNPMFPAAYSFVLGVQAAISGGGLAPFSNFDCNGPNYSSVSTINDPDGFNYELRAPGVDLLSTIPGGKYKSMSGTSMASPLVAGAISALKMVKEYANNEILWGDLLHSSNIAEACAVTNRPAELDILRIQLQNRKDIGDETEEDYSGDHEIDAGETVSIYPVIRTTFGAASNIKLKLELDEFEDDQVVDIQTGVVDFGWNLNAYGRNVSANPMVMKIADDVADGRHIKMKVVATCDESSVTYEWPFTVVVTNMVKISGLISSDMTLKADHIYLVNENIGIMEGATLTIEPGTRIEFMEGMGLSSFGKLVAKGTPEKPIVFTGNHGALWAGINSHASEGRHEHFGGYTNEGMTLFTLEATDQTTIFTGQVKQLPDYADYWLYYAPGEDSPAKSFAITDYMENWEGSDFTARMNLLSDPDYMSTALQRAVQAAKDYYNSLPDYYKEQAPGKYSTDILIEFPYWETYDNPRDSISYCRIDCFDAGNALYYPYMKDCVVTPNNVHNDGYAWNLFYSLAGERNNITEVNGSADTGYLTAGKLRYSNIVNNYFGWNAHTLLKYSQLAYDNYFNNSELCMMSGSGKYYGKSYMLGYNSERPGVDHSNMPSYLGTGREDIVRPYLYEIGNAPSTYGQIDLSNMPNRPYAEAHGIVWKVCVNDKDAQDEYDLLAPIGVGKHKFEVYFNRPMNKAVAPQIAFGVRDPYTQNAVDEDGDGFGWNADGTVYTAYKTISGKTKSDGVNRIYVWGAQDNEFFECPYEKMRFNIQINAAGSMATGFAGEALMGGAKLTWNNAQNNFDDAMGFNIYRYADVEKMMPVLDEFGNQVCDYDENGNPVPKEALQLVCDTVRLNTDVLDIETTTYTDYDVVPGKVYNYYYKVLSTDLKEYDVSNVVAVTPLSSVMGDANGSGEVDVADVQTIVCYITGEEPKPFIFEAADMNKDLAIDVLDLIGVIKKIIPVNGAPATTMAEATAVYTIEDGVLYVESPVALAGVQAQVNLDGRCKKDDVRIADELNGFEQVSAWLSDNDYLFLAYNLNGKTLTAGKHALLYVGDAEVSGMRLSDPQGHNVMAVAGEGATSIDAMGSKVMRQEGIYDLQGRKVTTLKKGVYIVNGEKVVK